MRSPSLVVKLLLFAALTLSTTASAQTILRYTDHEPLGGMRTKFIKEVFFAAIEKESNGRLKIQDNWDSKIATGYEALGAIGAGKVADMGIAVPEYTESALPLQQIFKSFPVGPTGARQVAFFRRVYDDVPAFQAEFAKSNVVAIFLATGYPVAFFSVAPLKTLDELKGRTWRSASFWHKDFLTNAGATPITMRWGAEVFNAMKAGTLEGLMVNVDSGYMLKVHEVAPNIVASRDLWLGHVYPLVMNLKTWSALPQADRDAIRRAAVTAYSSLGSVMNASFDEMVKDIRNAGARIRLLDIKEADAFAIAARYREVQDAWVPRQAEKGLKDAASTMTKVRSLLEDALK